MFDTFFDALGSLVASGPGILIVAALSGAIILVWNWRLAVGGVVAVQLAMDAMLTHLHGAPGILMAGQVMAIVLAAIMLGGSNRVRGTMSSISHGSNWIVRLFALFFVTVAWWFVDPGFTFPRFAQPETDLIIWIALCGLLILCLGDDPLFVATAIFMWLTTCHALATVLLPGSGIPALIGMTTLLVALSCSYLLLTEPVEAPQYRHRSGRLLAYLRRHWWSRIEDKRQTDQGAIARTDLNSGDPADRNLSAERSA